MLMPGCGLLPLSAAAVNWGLILLWQRAGDEGCSRVARTQHVPVGMDGRHPRYLVRPGSRKLGQSLPDGCFTDAEPGCPVRQAVDSDAPAKGAKAGRALLRTDRP